MEELRNQACVALKRHIDPSLEMLEELINHCPNELWLEINGGFPFWEQLYHAIYWCHRWFRESYYEGFKPVEFGKVISPDLEGLNTEFLSKDELRNYMDKVKCQVDSYFKGLNDEILFEPIKTGANLTYFDVILSQIRHIQYHVGHCNSVLRDKNVTAVEWIAYGGRRQ